MTLSEHSTALHLQTLKRVHFNSGIQTHSPETTAGTAEFVQCNTANRMFSSHRTEVTYIDENLLIERKEENETKNEK